VPFAPTAARLWRSLDPPTRERAAHAFWQRPPEEAAAAAARALVELLRIRPQAFARLAPEARVRALARLAQPPEAVADALLVALHLAERRALLAAFLDALGVPHDEGMIGEEVEIAPVDAARARRTLVGLRAAHPPAAIRLYWNALWLQDRERWAGLAAVADEI
jgi:hypothetical protein